MHTKAVTEMLIRHWLSTIKELVEEYKLTIHIELVRSHANQADQTYQSASMMPGCGLEETESVCTVCIEEQESLTFKPSIDVVGTPCIL